MFFFGGNPDVLDGVTEERAFRQNKALLRHYRRKAMLSVACLEDRPGKDPRLSQRFKVGAGVPPAGPSSSDMSMSSFYQCVYQSLLTSPEQECIHASIPGRKDEHIDVPMTAFATICVAWSFLTAQEPFPGNPDWVGLIGGF